jgi:hypothetical protein
MRGSRRRTLWRQYNVFSASRIRIWPEPKLPAGHALSNRSATISPRLSRFSPTKPRSFAAGVSVRSRHFRLPRLAKVYDPQHRAVVAIELHPLQVRHPHGPHACTHARGVNAPRVGDVGDDAALRVREEWARVGYHEKTPRRF